MHLWFPVGTDAACLGTHLENYCPQGKASWKEAHLEVDVLPSFEQPWEGIAMFCRASLKGSIQPTSLHLAVVSPIRIMEDAGNHDYSS